jgi:hypothetical protein
LFFDHPGQLRHKFEQCFRTLPATQANTATRTDSRGRDLAIHDERCHAYAVLALSHANDSKPVQSRSREGFDYVLLWRFHYLFPEAI